jgi:hypothetical protein
MELWVNEIWLLVTAVVFTAVGWYWGLKSSVLNVSEAVIDSLIEQKYLKTRGYGENMEILKYTEWCEKK